MIRICLVLLLTSFSSFVRADIGAYVGKFYFETPSGDCRAEVLRGHSGQYSLVIWKYSLENGSRILVQQEGVIGQAMDLMSGAVIRSTQLAMENPRVLIKRRGVIRHDPLNPQTVVASVREVVDGPNLPEPFDDRILECRGLLKKRIYTPSDARPLDR